MTVITDSSNPKVVLHGVLVSIEDVGVLLLGESGLGKSECALELLSRGHCLVADDVVEVERIGDGLYGIAPEGFAGQLEVRGLGIVDVKRLFGSFSYKLGHSIDFCIEFRRREASEFLERIKNDRSEFEILGLKIPLFILPIDHGRNLGLLVETVVKLRKNGGFIAERGFINGYDDTASNFSAV